MRIIILTLITFSLSGCIKSVITQADKDRLLTADDLVSLGCKSTTEQDLEFETNGLKHLSKAITVTYDGHNKCGFYLNIELTEVKLVSMGEYFANQAHSATMLGLKIANLTTKKPASKYDGLHGEYIEAYDENGKYLGFIYTSEKNSKYLIAMIFSKKKEHQAVFFDLLELIETRNLEKGKKLPKTKRYFADSYV